MNKKKIIILVSISALLALAVFGFVVFKNKGSNKKSVDIWHKVAISSNKVGDFAGASISDANTDKLTESIVEMNTTVDDAQFNTAKLSYLIRGGERKANLSNSLDKIKGYNNKLKAILDIAASSPDNLTDEQIAEIKSLSDDMKNVVDKLTGGAKFSESLSTGYYTAYMYPENLSQKASANKQAEADKAKTEANAKKAEEEGLKASKTVVEGFLAAYVRKDFPAMKSNMTNGFQNEFKFSDIENAWPSSHPKSYRIIESKADNQNYTVSVNITYFTSYNDASGNPFESENTSSQKYRVTKSDGGAYLVDGEVYNY